MSKCTTSSRSRQNIGEDVVNSFSRRDLLTAAAAGGPVTAAVAAIAIVPLQISELR
jgi:hypothetical protein